MEDKYYTPQIEEFYVGFEFERAGITSDIDILNWHKDIFETTTCLETINNYKGLQRVKYLDQEDIESLGGLKHLTIDNYWKIDGFVLRLKNQILTIYIFDEYTVDKLIFQGVVKNKSELKKLMQQLKILE